MKKYRVTEKHSHFKENLEIHFRGTVYFLSVVDYYTFSLEELKEWIESVWIEEIQEPEFTKQDMIEFAEYYDYKNPYDAYNILNGWLKKKEIKQTTYQII